MSYRRRQRMHRTPWDADPRVRHFGSSPSIPVPPPPMELPPMPEFPPIEFPEMPAMEMPEFPPFPAPFDPTAAEAARRRAEQVATQRSIERRRKGYGSTLLTGGRGDETEPPLSRPGLLGR